MGPKKFLGPKKFWFEKKFCPKKTLGQKKNMGGGKKFGKHHLCVTIRFLVFYDIADFGGVLLVLLVTWVLRTPNPLNSAKSP